MEWAYYKAECGSDGFYTLGVLLLVICNMCFLTVSDFHRKLCSSALTWVMCYAWALPITNQELHFVSSWSVFPGSWHNSSFPLPIDCLYIYNICVDTCMYSGLGMNETGGHVSESVGQSKGKGQKGTEWDSGIYIVGQWGRLNTQHETDGDILKQVARRSEVQWDRKIQY